MIYLLDADVLITANRQYYPIDRIPGFWDWLIERGSAGDIKIAEEILDEFSGGNDRLAEWAQKSEVVDALRLDATVDVDVLRHVIDNGYASDLTDDEVEEIGRDPFLIAYALIAPSDRAVVTLERKKPTARRAKRKIPDVCLGLGVTCIDTFQMTTALNFRL